MRCPTQGIHCLWPQIRGTVNSLSHTQSHIITFTLQFTSLAPAWHTRPPAGHINWSLQKLIIWFILPTPHPIYALISDGHYNYIKGVSQKQRKKRKENMGNCYMREYPHSFFFFVISILLLNLCYYALCLWQESMVSVCVPMIQRMINKTHEKREISIHRECGWVRCTDAQQVLSGAPLSFP